MALSPGRFASLPDQLIASSIEGNDRFPQTLAGHVIYSGSLVTQLVLQEELSWDQYACAQPSQQQLKVMLRAASDRHKQLGIVCTGHQSHTPKRFNAERMRELLAGTALSVIRTTALYAADVLSDPSYKKLRDGNTPDTALYYHHRHLFRALFVDSPTSPETQNLLGMWQTARQALAGEQGTAISGRLVAGLVEAAADRERMDEISAMASEDMYHLALQAVRAYSDTPLETREAFVSNVVYQDD